MRKTLSILFLLAVALCGQASAQLSQCAITATIYDNNGDLLSGARIVVVKVVKNGSLISNTPLTYTTNASGVATFNLPRSSVAWIWANSYGLNANGSAGVAVTVPAAASANLEELAAFSSVLTTLGDLAYGGASGVFTRLAGNTSATAKFLCQQGNGTTSTAPGWCAFAASGNLTLTYDNNARTATFGYAPSSSELLTAFGAQSANTFPAGPTTGSAAVPGWRGLVAADIPNLASIYQPLDSDLTNIAALTTTSFGRGLLTEANAASLLGTLSAAPLASPAFTGTPTVPTAASGTNTTQVASAAFVQGEIVSNATPDASTTVKGKIEIATQAELESRTDTTRTVTPALVGTQRGKHRVYTYADLITYTTTYPDSAAVEDGDEVRVSDNNRGFYRWNASASKWVSVNNGVYAPHDYGVKGDNSSNDTAAWATFLAAIPDYATIILPNGFKSLVTSIDLSGRKGLYFQGTNAGAEAANTHALPVIKMTGAAGGTLITCSPCQSIVFEGVLLDGANLADKVFNATYNGSPTYDVTFRRVQINASSGGGSARTAFIGIDWCGTGTTSNCERLVVENSTLYGTAGTSIGVRIGHSNSLNNAIEGNNFSDFGTQISTAGTVGIRRNLFNASAIVDIAAAVSEPLEIAYNRTENGHQFFNGNAPVFMHDNVFGAHLIAAADAWIDNGKTSTDAFTTFYNNHFVTDDTLPPFSSSLTSTLISKHNRYPTAAASGSRITTMANFERGYSSEGDTFSGGAALTEFTTRGLNSTVAVTSGSTAGAPAITATGSHTSASATGVYGIKALLNGSGSGAAIKATTTGLGTTGANAEAIMVDADLGAMSGNGASAYSLMARGPSSTGTWTNLYGAYIGPHKISGVTNGWGVYQIGAADINYFNGNVGIGTNAPNARLQITNASASDVGLIIKAAAGQTGPLLQWQNSSDVVLSRIDNNGLAEFRSMYAVAGGASLGISTISDASLVNTGIIGDSTNSYVAIKLSGTERLRLTNGAQLNLGVGRIGFNSVTSPTAFLISPAAATLQLGDSDATGPVAQTLSAQSVVAGTSNGNGATTKYVASLSTGNAVPGRQHFQGSPLSATSATTVNAAIDRLVLGATKVLTNNSATTVVNVTAASNTVAAGVIDYTVEVFDGTELQVEVGSVSYMITNKGGAFSGNTTSKFGNQQNLTSGTLTVTWAISGANPGALSVNANSSLTPSTGYPRVTYALKNTGNQGVSVQ